MDKHCVRVRMKAAASEKRGYFEKIKGNNIAVPLWYRDIDKRVYTNNVNVEPACFPMFFSLQSWHMNQPKSILFDLVMYLTLLTTSFRPPRPQIPSEWGPWCVPAESTRATQSLSLPSYLHGWLLAEDEGVWVCDVGCSSLLCAMAGVQDGLCGSPKDFPKEFPRRKATSIFWIFLHFHFDTPPVPAKRKEGDKNSTVLQFLHMYTSFICFHIVCLLSYCFSVGTQRTALL